MKNQAKRKWQSRYFKLSRRDADIIERGHHAYAMLLLEHSIFDVPFHDYVLSPVATLRCFQGGASLFEPNNFRPIRPS